MINEKKYVEKLLDSRDNDNNLFKDLSISLLKKIKSDVKLTRAIAFAKESNVSNAMITKYIKHLQIPDWQTLRYIHNIIIENKFTVVKNVKYKNYEEVAKMIEGARKIMFLGVSSSQFTNNDFANKLERIDKWVVKPVNKYEQIGLSKLLIEKDVLIVNSISMQHKWMVDVVKSTNARVIVITSNKSKFEDIRVDHIINIGSGGWETTPSRTYTTALRRKILEIYDEIYEIIVKKPENAHLLRLTAYN